MRPQLFLALFLVIPAVFLADKVNQRELHRLLLNAAGGKPPMRGVQFVFPLIPHPTPSPTPIPVYPAAIFFGNDIVLRYVSLGDGYWQTPAFNMVFDEALSDNDEWQGDFLFKFNPASDPMHPGHSIVAVSGGRSRAVFANLGTRDFYGVSSFAGAHWMVPSAGETPAVWPLVAGDVVAMKIETNLAVPLPPPATGSATSSAVVQPRKPGTVKKLTFAKLFIRFISQDTVRFDYVYRTDGSDYFPRPR